MWIWVLTGPQILISRTFKDQSDFPGLENTHPFNGPFSGTSRVSLYQKGIINVDFTEARDSEW